MADIVRANRYWLMAAAVVAVASGVVLVRLVPRSADEPRPLTAAEYSASVILWTTPFQRQILQDGVVTFHEYEAAKKRTIQCARDAGLEVDVRPAVGLRPSSYGISAPAEEEMEAAKATLAECEKAFLSDVEMTRAHAGYTDDELADGLVALNTCLRADGGPALPELQSMADVGAVFPGTPDEANLKEWGATHQRYSHCKATVEEQTGFRFS